MHMIMFRKEQKSVSKNNNVITILNNLTGISPISYNKTKIKWN